jgi:ketosteroid isomerase-like protein
MTTQTISTQRRKRSRRPAFVLLIVACAVQFATPLFALRPISNHKNNEVKQQVEELEQQWRTAQLAGDVAMMDKLLSDDYIGISMNGQVNTKAQQLARVNSRRVTLTRLDLTEMKVKLIGAIAIVTSRAEVEGTSDGESVKGTYRYTRVYQHLPTGAWKITSFEATRIPQPGSPSSRASSPTNPPNPSRLFEKMLLE